MSYLIDQLSVFILVYNEEKNLRKSIDSVRKILPKISKEFEIVMVYYDGSTDKSLEIIKEYMDKYDYVKIAHQKKDERGYGKALQIGIKHAKYEHIFYTDGDNQFAFEEIIRLIPFIDKYDIVGGYRLKRRDPPMRILTAKVYNVILNTLFLARFRDVDCAFKLYKKKIFKKFEVTSDSGLADAEILIKAKKNGFKILEVPVTHYPRVAGEAVFEDGNNGMLKFSVMFKILIDIFKFRIKLFFD